MAKDALGTVITLGIVGVGGYWLYSSGILSSLFGSSSAAPTTPPSTSPPAGGTNPVPAPPAGPSCAPAGSLAKILSLAQAGNPALKLGPSGTDTLTIDQWDYYANQWCTGYADKIGLNADSLFPGRDDRGGPLNWNAFVGYAQPLGLSGLGARRGRDRRVGRRFIGTHPVRRAA